MQIARNMYIQSHISQKLNWIPFSAGWPETWFYRQCRSSTNTMIRCKITVVKQKRIYDPVKHLWWSFFEKIIHSFRKSSISGGSEMLVFRKPLTIFVKTLHHRQGYKYASRKDACFSSLLLTLSRYLSNQARLWKDGIIQKFINRWNGYIQFTEHYKWK